MITIYVQKKPNSKYRYLLGSFPGRLPMIGYGYLFTPDMARPEKLKVEEMWDRIAN